MADIAHRIQKSFEEIVDWGNPSIPSVDVVYTYGQVIHDETKDNEKFGEHSVALMISENSFLWDFLVKNWILAMKNC